MSARWNPDRRRAGSGALRVLPQERGADARGLRRTPRPRRRRRPPPRRRAVRKHPPSPLPQSLPPPVQPIIAVRVGTGLGADGGAASGQSTFKPGEDAGRWWT